MNPLEEANQALDRAIETERRNKMFVESIGPAIVESLLPVIAEGLRNINVTVSPEIIMPTIPRPDVHVEAPIVNVPEPVVNVTIPPIKVPRSEVKVTMATKALTNEVKKVTDAIKAQPIPMFNSPDYTFKKPIPAIMVDAKGKPMDFGGGSRVMSLTRFMDSNNNPINVSATNPLPVDASLSITETLDVKQVSGANWSMYITGAAASTYAELLNPDGRVKVELPTGTTGITDTELRAATLDVKQVSGSQDSVVINSSLVSFETKQVSGFADSVYVTGSADSMLAYQARTTNPTATSDGGDVRPSADKLGRTLTRPMQVRDLMSTAYVSISTGIETTLLGAGGAGVMNDLVYIMAANQSSVSQNIDVRAVNAGNIIMTLAIPANATAGVSLPVPFPQSEPNNAWTVDNSGTDVSNTTINISALFSKEV